MSLVSCDRFDNDKCTSVYLIRHAEKVRTNKNEKDPLLNKRGLLRAKKWSEIFQKIEINKILSTDTKRTISTVIPTSEEKKVKVELYRPKEITY